MDLSPQVGAVSLIILIGTFSSILDVTESNPVYMVGYSTRLCLRTEGIFHDQRCGALVYPLETMKRQSSHLFISPPSRLRPRHLVHAESHYSFAGAQDRYVYNSFTDHRESHEAIPRTADFDLKRTRDSENDPRMSHPT